MKMKDKDNKFDFYTLDEFSEIWDKEERLVFVDCGVDEVVARYDDIADIIVDTNLKLGSTDLSIYEFESGEKLLNTYGMFLDKCLPEIRKDIINRLVKLQNMEIKPKKYKLLSEETLSEFYEMCEGFNLNFDDPYTDYELDLMEKEYLNSQFDDYSFEERED